jgi:hypothetical protein
MAKIYYVGDWAVMLGPCFAETTLQLCDEGDGHLQLRHLAQGVMMIGKTRNRTIPTRIGRAAICLAMLLATVRAEQDYVLAPAPREITWQQGDCPLAPGSYLHIDLTGIKK